MDTSRIGLNMSNPQFSTVIMVDTYDELKTSIKKELGNRTGSVILFKSNQTTYRMGKYKKHKLKIGKEQPMAEKTVSFSLLSLSKIITLVPTVQKSLGNSFWIAITFPG